MSSSGDEVGFLWKASIAVWTAFGGVMAWFAGRLDKKVSKDVFKEYKDKNDLAHGMTHSALKEMKRDAKEACDKIFNKLDDKQDKS